MKPLSILCLFFLITSLSLAQEQPFEQYGYKVKVATLSKGKYVEFFDADTLVEIGSVIINTNNGQIVYFVNYDTTYSEADLQPNVISRWFSPDPLSNKYYSYSPYNFVLNNPIRFIDPDGTTVTPTDDKALDALKNGLSSKEAKYVRLDKNGSIDTKRLERGAKKLKGGSDSYAALGVLAKSSRTYTISVAKDYKTKDDNRNIVSNELEPMQNTESGKPSGTFGITLTPDSPNGDERSADGKINIFINPTLSKRDQATTVAHEAFGHAYFYELYRQGHDVNPFHDYQSEGGLVDGVLNLNFIDANKPLVEQIKKVEQAAGNNYDQRFNDVRK